MLVMLLRHTLHGAEVAVAEQYRLQRPLAFFRPICPQLELTLRTERQRNDEDVLKLAPEEALVVSVPTNRHPTILVQV